MISFMTSSRWMRAVLLTLILISFLFLLSHHHNSHWSGKECPVCLFVSHMAASVAITLIMFILSPLIIVELFSPFFPYKPVLSWSFPHRAPPSLP
jgi:putative flippase GtrA